MVSRKGIKDISSNYNTESRPKFALYCSYIFVISVAICVYYTLYYSNSTIGWSR
jgi:hypothetical protein